MAEGRWTETRAAAWYREQPWLVGCNFTPSTASNQIEMWQAESFDLATIDRELGWAASLGFNTARVFLHDLVWAADPAGFKRRIDQFLRAAAGHGIRPMLVIFDDCWHPNPRLGPQPDPIPGVHNSRWVQSPGPAILGDRRRWGLLEAYVKDIVGSFGADERVLIWDLYNEPTNNFLPLLNLKLPWRQLRIATMVVQRLTTTSPSLALLRKSFEWARAAAPSQPLTAGVWVGDPRLNAELLALSDVISFHNYETPRRLEAQIARLRRHGRPLLCTEYMSRGRGCSFESHMPIFHREGIGCYNWGLVSGRTQTIYAWRSPGGAAEPDLWFHDILRPDGSPYLPEEVALIRRYARPQAQPVGMAA